MRSSTPTECAFIEHCWIPPFFAFCHQNYKLPKKSKNFIKKDWQIKSAVLLYRQPTKRVVNFERRIASWRHCLTQPIPPECACVCALIVMPFFDAFSIHELNAFKMLLTGNLERVSRFIFWRDFYVETIYGSSQSQLQIRTNVPMLT